MILIFNFSNICNLVNVPTFVYLWQHLDLLTYSSCSDRWISINLYWDGISQTQRGEDEYPCVQYHRKEIDVVTLMIWDRLLGVKYLFINELCNDNTYCNLIHLYGQLDSS